MAFILNHWLYTLQLKCSKTWWLISYFVRNILIVQYTHDNELAHMQQHETYKVLKMHGILGKDWLLQKLSFDEVSRGIYKWIVYKGSNRMYFLLHNRCIREQDSGSKKVSFENALVRKFMHLLQREQKCMCNSFTIIPLKNAKAYTWSCVV